MNEIFKNTVPSVRTAEERIKRNREIVKKCVAIALENATELRNNRSFEDTTRNRTLFTPHSERSIMIKPLAMSLFHIDPEDNFPALEEKIDGKKILLIGGGRSMEDLTSTRRLSPKAILNVDPYLQEDAPTRKLSPQYRHVKFDATAHDMPQQVRELGYDTFDEIWCTYSIPQYCKTELDVVDALLNLEELLAPDGTIRINPIAFYSLTRSSGRGSDRQKYLREVSAGFTKGLNQLAEKKDIEMSMFPDRAYPGEPVHTLLIHKLNI